MTIDKVKLEAVLASVDDAIDYVTVAKNRTNEADPDNEFNPTFVNIFTELAGVEAWANAKLLEAEQDQVMNSFLAEMKVVFDKYTAKLEIGSSSDGYGIDWGNANPNAGVKFTAKLNGVTATKEINKVIITSEDLV